MDLTITSLFRKHYIFWLEDEIWDQAVYSLLQEFQYPDLFYVSIAQGVYSSLQIFGAIKQKHFPQFDLAIIDVLLDDAQCYFKEIDKIENTMPIFLVDKRYKSIYEYPDGNELEYISEYSTLFNFDFSEVKREIKGKGGLFVWAWASSVCNEAEYIIYSADDKIQEFIKFLSVAGILDVRKKGDLFKIEINAHKEQTGKYLREYMIASREAFRNIQTIKYKPLDKENYTQNETAEGNDILRGEIIIKTPEEGFIDVSYFNVIKQEEMPTEAYIIHKIGKKENDTKWEVTYERYDKFCSRIISNPEPYFIKKLIKVLTKKIFLNQVNSFIIRTLLDLQDKQGKWTIIINGTPQFSWKEVPFYLVPLGGDFDETNHTVTLADEETAKNTYLFVTFFLPWAKDLLSNDPNRIDSAISDIEEKFKTQLKNGCSLMREFCDGNKPFHKFIEASAETDDTWKNTNLVLRQYNNLNIGEVLSIDTSACIKEYLTGGKPQNIADKWKNIKDKFILGKGNTKTFFSFFTNQKQLWEQKGYEVTIIPELRPDTNRWYADTDWIFEVLIQVVLDNLTDDKAFDEGKGFNATPKIILNFSKTKAHLSISIEDNGVGFDIKQEIIENQSSRYNSSFLVGEGARLLRFYGELIIESKQHRFNLSKQKLSELDSPRLGTLVTIFIFLG